MLHGSNAFPHDAAPTRKTKQVSQPGPSVRPRDGWALGTEKRDLLEELGLADLAVLVEVKLVDHGLPGERTQARVVIGGSARALRARGGARGGRVGTRAKGWSVLRGGV